MNVTAGHPAPAGPIRSAMTNTDHHPSTDPDIGTDASNGPDQTDDLNPIADPTATAHPTGEDQAAENRENEPPA
jgi:hypothetical protein